MCFVHICFIKLFPTKIGVVLGDKSFRDIFYCQCWFSRAIHSEYGHVDFLQVISRSTHHWTNHFLEPICSIDARSQFFLSLGGKWVEFQGFIKCSRQNSSKYRVKVNYGSYIRVLWQRPHVILSQLVRLLFANDLLTSSGRGSLVYVIYQRNPQKSAGVWRTGAAVMARRCATLPAFLTAGPLSFLEKCDWSKNFYAQ